MKKEIIEEIFVRWKKQLPKPTTELDYTNTYTLLVAVVMSAQSTDVGVNKATKELFKVADTPEKMVKLGLDGLKQHIKTIGLYNNKAKNVIALSKQLIEKHNSEVPDDRASLEDLPGVGRKTANVVLNTAFGHPVIAVDTHIFRVSNRIGFGKGKTPLDVEKKLIKNVPDTFKVDAHHWIILHGRYTCKAQKPDCKNCIINDLCGYKKKLL